MATRGQKLAAASSVVVITEPLMALAHQGGLGVIAGLALGAVTYAAVGDIKKVVAGNNEPATPKTTEKKVDEKPSLAHRMFVGKSVREGQPHEDAATQMEDMEALAPNPLNARSLSEDDLASLETIIQQGSGALPGACKFSATLQAFTPTKDKIFLGYLPGGQAVFVAVEDLCHVALAGLTGNGKTTLIRLLVSQLEYVGANVLILNPHYTSYDIKKHEDWTPIERNLYRPPVTDFAAIGSVMKWVATTLLRDRLEKYRQSVPWGSPIFVVVDELPAIVEYVPEFPEYVSAILREGRKVDILLVVAAQDFQVKTVGPNEAGAVRKNYKTKMYVGGDVTTAKVLLDMPPAQIPENMLGEGIIMMRNKAVKTASLARVPYVDNNALYMLLGPSTYTPSKQRHDEEDDLMDYLGSNGHYEGEDTHTDELPVTKTHTSGKRSIAPVAARREAREQRLRGAMVTRGQSGSVREAVVETPVAEKSELSRALEAYDAGNTTIDALAVALDKTPWTVRPIYAQVKKLRGSK